MIKNLSFFKNKKIFPLLLILILIVVGGSIGVWVNYRIFSKAKHGQISDEGWSYIQREKIKAQRNFAEFIKTPAGKVWLKHPYWTPEICQKIAQGEILVGMHKDQVKESLASLLQRKIKISNYLEGNTLWEEWLLEGEDKLILRFRDNLLQSLERK